MRRIEQVSPRDNEGMSIDDECCWQAMDAVPAVPCCVTHQLVL